MDYWPEPDFEFDPDAVRRHLDRLGRLRCPCGELLVPAARLVELVYFIAQPERDSWRGDGAPNMLIRLDCPACGHVAFLNPDRVPGIFDRLGFTPL